jgi:hypothetical protein
MEVRKLRRCGSTGATERQLDDATFQQIAAPNVERMAETQSLLSDEQCDLQKEVAEIARSPVTIAASAKRRAEEPMRSTADPSRASSGCRGRSAIGLRAAVDRREDVPEDLDMASVQTPNARSLATDWSELSDRPAILRDHQRFA